MHQSIPLFNWSLRKAQDTEPDSFIRARISIAYTIILFALLKSIIVLFISINSGLWLQVPRAAFVLAVYVIMLKVLLYKPSSLKILTHIMTIVGILIIVSNIYLYTHKINLISLQFVFMIMLTGFYILGNGWGIIYSLISALPIIIFLILKGNPNIYFSSATQEIPSPGVEIIAVLNFVSIIINHSLFYRAFQRNLNEKENLNQQLQLSVAEANSLAISRTNFLATISHELRTPLNSVIGITDLLLLDQPEERQKENLRILQFSAQDLLSLINNVLDFNKLESDKMVLERVPFCLAEFMRNICSALMVKADDKKLRFVLEIDHKLEGVVVNSDPTRLSQLIYNLVGNAIKFTDKGTITIRLDCIHKSDQTTDVLFSVTDTGAGINPEKHDAIFELFTQAESDTTRKYGGTGLGLAIVKQVLALLNSEIHLESSPGKGSRFYFTVSFVVQGEYPETISTRITDNTNFNQLKILIAEDNDVNRFILKKHLDKLNINATMVANGKQAYEAILADDYRLLIMDLQMPEWDGYETIKQIRSIKGPAKAGIYIIAFTASVTEQQKIMDASFNDYLYKPVTLNDLKVKLEKTLSLIGLA